MDWKGIGIFAVAMTVVAQAVHTAESVLTMGYYIDPAYFGLWSKVMMPKAGAPPIEFFTLSLAFAFATWFLFGCVFGKLGKVIGENGFVKKGLVFGGLVFLIAGVPFTLTSYLLFNVPTALLLAWATSSLLLYLAGGVLAARLVKP